jgi:uncharacterized protein (DUF362 family)
MLIPRGAFALPPSKLAVAGGEPAQAVSLALEALGGIDAFVKQGETVVLKPNVGFPNPPHWGSTTHPQVVVAVAGLCLEAGASKVLVVDHPLRKPELCFRRSGLQDALKGMKGVHLLAPKRKTLYEEVEVPQGRSLHRTRVMRALLDADRWINLPTAKSHSATGVSLGLKNLMGLVWDRATFHRDLDLDQAVADLATILKPSLTIMDAAYALVSAGPGGPGPVERWNRVIAGVDPVAVDAYTVGLGAWYGRRVRPDQVKHLRAARALGLGNTDMNALEIVERGA